MGEKLVCAKIHQRTGVVCLKDKGTHRIHAGRDMRSGKQVWWTHG